MVCFMASQVCTVGAEGRVPMTPTAAAVGEEQPVRRVALTACKQTVREAWAALAASQQRLVQEWARRCKLCRASRSTKS